MSLDTRVSRLESKIEQRAATKLDHALRLLNQARRKQRNGLLTPSDQVHIDAIGAILDRAQDRAR